MKTVFNDKIITQSLCCWPQVLQRIINFKLTEHCFGYRDPFRQRCNRIHTMKLWAIHSLLTFTVSIKMICQLKIHKSQPDIIYKYWFLYCCAVFFLVFFCVCACQHFAIQLKKKHTLEFSYYFQVDVSHISHLQFKLQLLKTVQGTVNTRI